MTNACEYQPHFKASKDRDREELPWMDGRSWTDRSFTTWHAPPLLIEQGSKGNWYPLSDLGWVTGRWLCGYDDDVHCFCMLLYAFSDFRRTPDTWLAMRCRLKAQKMEPAAFGSQLLHVHFDSMLMAGKTVWRIGAYHQTTLDQESIANGCVNSSFDQIWWPIISSLFKSIGNFKTGSCFAFGFILSKQLTHPGSPKCSFSVNWFVCATNFRWFLKIRSNPIGSFVQVGSAWCVAKSCKIAFVDLTSHAADLHPFGAVRGGACERSRSDASVFVLLFAIFAIRILKRGANEFQKKGGPTKSKEKAAECLGLWGLKAQNITSKRQNHYQLLGENLYPG